MIIETCNLIGQENLLIDNLKLSTLNFGEKKTLLIPKKIIDLSF